MSTIPSPSAGPTPGAVPGATAPYAWQTCLDIRNNDGHVYEHHFNPALLDVLAHPPRVLLDIGCAAGLLGQEVKSRHPACRVIGIEPNAATARLAAEHLDQVLCGKFEDFDLAAEGLAPGSIDTVIAADVLEHMYNPWQVMLALKPYLTADAQLILSIPNTRHIGLLKALADAGRWTYAEKGLLDITHIRFFTLAEIERFLSQTGYRMEFVNHVLDPNFERFFHQNRHKAEISVSAGRFALERITPRELAELCTWQFHVRARV